MSRRETSRDFKRDTRYIHWRVVPAADALSSGDGKDYLHIHPEIVGYHLIDVQASIDDPSSSSGIALQLYSMSDSANLLTSGAPVTVDSGEYTSTSASTPSVVVSNTFLKSADRLRADVDANGNGAKGLVYHLTIRNY